MKEKIMLGLGVRTADGPIEVLNLPNPRSPIAGELVLEVLAAGIGPWDALLHTGGWDVGLRLPAALGVEAVGRVVDVGPGETEFSRGDVVLVHEAPLPGGSGTWANLVLVHSAHAALLPHGLDPLVAAGLPVAGLTAVQALDDLQVDTTTRLLVIGASGPTASLAVQLAHQRGADVVAGAGLAHATQLRAFGARDVIDTHVAGWAKETEQRFDAVLIAARGTADDAMDLLVDGGRLCSITSDAPESVRGITSTNLYIRPDGSALGDLAALAATGKLQLKVQSTPLKDGAARADEVASGRSGGTKHVLAVA